MKKCFKFSFSMHRNIQFIVFYSEKSWNTLFFPPTNKLVFSDEDKELLISFISSVKDFFFEACVLTFDSGFPFYLHVSFGHSGFFVPYSYRRLYHFCYIRAKKTK